MTTPFWLIALGGLLGSSHCVGMCGGFAVLVGPHRSSWRQQLQGQLVFSAGRLASYCTFGAVAGYAGQTLAARIPAVVNVPALLCLAAGLFLMWEGLHAAGWLRRHSAGQSGAGCLLGPLYATMLRNPALRSTFSAGLFTGLLPCGLVYAFVSLAASTGDLLHGAATMLAFGLGTVPLMVLTGTGAMLLGVRVRQRLWQVAAWSVVVTGLLTIGRGVAFLQFEEASPPRPCPFCKPVDTPAAEAVTMNDSLHTLSWRCPS